MQYQNLNRFQRCAYACGLHYRFRDLLDSFNQRHLHLDVQEARCQFLWQKLVKHVRSLQARGTPRALVNRELVLLFVDLLNKEVESKVRYTQETVSKDFDFADVEEGRLDQLQEQGVAC